MVSKDATCRASKSRGVVTEDWRMVLKCADTFSKRTKAIRTAISLDATLREIEEYLDYLDMSSPRAKQIETTQDAQDGLNPNL